jgi:hypothetical protein
MLFVMKFLKQKLKQILGDKAYWTYDKALKYIQRKK